MCLRGGGEEEEPSDSEFVDAERVDLVGGPGASGRVRYGAGRREIGITMLDEAKEQEMAIRSMTTQRINSYKVDELKTDLRVRGLSQRGKKPVHAPHPPAGFRI